MASSSRLHEVTARAIVLRRWDSGESDRRLTILTREFGKLDVIAKGARKGGSRLAGISEPLVLGDYHWAEGKHRRFITQAQPVTSWPGIRSDYDRLSAGLAAVELIAEAMPYESPDEDHFETLELGLRAIDQNEKWEPALAWIACRLLVIEGRAPDWEVCQATGEAAAERPAWVSPIAGGRILAQECGMYQDSFSVPPEALIGLARLSEREEPPANLKFAPECLTVLLKFWQADLDRPLRAFQGVLKPVSFDS